MLTLQQVSDRLEIQDLLIDYSHAIDTQDWDALDDVFTADAFIDYTAMGGSKGNLEETKAFLRGTMPRFAGYQHMVATSKVTIEGDTGNGRTICHNPMVLGRPDGESHVFFCGLWYRDRFVRTPAGWRIKERVEERSYIWNLPGELPV
jgi:3-phenylpropionate/cinnamic acid dioxygenase small subunit